MLLLISSFLAATVQSGLAFATPALSVRQQVPSSDVPTGSWTARGCWVDNSTSPLLTAVGDFSSSMSVDECLTLCAKGNYTLAGLSFASECFCDNKLEGDPAEAPDSDCFIPCSGNDTQICGGPDRISLYAFNETAGSPAPVAPKNVGDWKFVDCFNDSADARTLTAPANLTTNITVETCTSGCYNMGFPLAGLEAGNQCFCGDAIDNFGAPAISDTQCNVTCAGNSSEICGGPDQLTLYNYTSVQEANGPPVAQVYLKNTGAFACYVRVVYDNITSDRLSHRLQGGQHTTVNLTKYALMAEGTIFKVKLDVVSGPDRTSHTELIYGTADPNSTARFHDGGGVASAWIAFDGYSDDVDEDGDAV